MIIEENDLGNLTPPTYSKAMKTTIDSYLKVVEHHVLHSVRLCNRSEKNHSRRKKLLLPKKWDFRRFYYFEKS